MRDIETIREQLHLSQEEFARMLGMSRRSYLYRLEGKLSWKIRELAIISSYCNDEIAVNVEHDTYLFRKAEKNNGI